MKTCPGCSRSVADIIGQCPFCRHTFAGPVNDKPMLDPELIAAAIAAERDEAQGGRAALLQTLLLMLGLPVLVPSLIWFWLGAKRWGRIDWILLAVTGGVLTLFALGSPYGLALMLIADAAAAALFVMRYGKLDDGIFLGYSNTVALPLIVAGLLAAWGTFAYMPVVEIAQLARLYGLEDDVTAAELTGRSAPAAPCPVQLKGATLSAARRLVSVRGTDGKPRLVKAPAAEPVAVADPKELWERHEELAGSIVHLYTPAPAETFVRANVTIQKSAKAAKQVDAPARVYGLLPGTGDRVWIASEPAQGDGAEEARQLAAGDRAGLLVISYAGPEITKPWAAKHGARPRPYMAVTLMPAVAPGPEADPMAPSYVPVEGTEDRLWVHFPHGPGWVSSSGLSGILEEHSERVRLVADTLPAHGGPVRVITLMARNEFAKASGLIDRATGGSLGTGLVILGLAALLVMVSLIASLRE